MKMFIRKFAPFLFAVCSLAIAAKRPLTHQDYDGWRSILSPAVSNDGQYLAYGLFPQEGDGVVIVRDLKSGRDWRENAGALPPPPAPDPNNEDAPPPQRSVRLAFTTDSKHLVFLAYPSKAETDQAKKDKKKADEMPKPSLLIFDLSAMTSSRVADVASFQVPENGPSLLAYLKGAKPGAGPAAASENNADYHADYQGRGGRGGGRGGARGN